MEVLKTLVPGRSGTHRYQRQYGDRLVAVRYRHDPQKKRRLTTVELIVDEAPFEKRTGTSTFACASRRRRNFASKSKPPAVDGSRRRNSGSYRTTRPCASV